LTNVFSEPETDLGFQSNNAATAISSKWQPFSSTAQETESHQGCQMVIFSYQKCLFGHLVEGFGMVNLCAFDDHSLFYFHFGLPILW
jgi:hypothetical protein